MACLEPITRLKVQRVELMAIPVRALNRDGLGGSTNEPSDELARMPVG